MEFHQSCAERFSERLFNHLSKHFDGKVMNSDEFNIDLMIKSVPFNMNDDDIIDLSPINNNNNDDEDTHVINDNQEDTPVINDNQDTPVINDNQDTPVINDNQDTPVINDNQDTPVINDEEELFTDNIIDEPVDNKKDKKNKKKKVKKEKVVDPNKPKRKPNAYIMWKTHPDNAESINTKSKEINDETDKPYGKTKAASVIWKSLDKDEQAKWKP